MTTGYFYQQGQGVQQTWEQAAELIICVMPVRWQASASVTPAQIKKHWQAVSAAWKAHYPAEFSSVLSYIAAVWVDEIIITSTHPLRQEWIFKPLQCSVHPSRVGGERFFQLYETWLVHMPDCLDVYFWFGLWQRLGFLGRYHNAPMQADRWCRKSSDALIEWEMPALSSPRMQKNRKRRFYHCVGWFVLFVAIILSANWLYWQSRWHHIVAPQLLSSLSMPVIGQGGG